MRLYYAQIHNQGGTITQAPTPKQRKFFWAMYKQTNNEMFLRSAKAKQITITIPQRKFIGNSAGLDKRIARQIQARLNHILLTSNLR